MIFTVQVLESAAALGLFWQAGYLILVHLPRIFSRLERFCLAFGLGVGVISSQMLMQSLLGLPIELIFIITPWVIAWLIFVIRASQRTSGPRWSKITPHSINFVWPTRQQSLWVVLCVFLALLCISISYRAMFSPIAEWDGWAIWDRKARAFFEHRSLTPFINDTYNVLTHLDYPLLLPLAGTLIHLMAGLPSDVVLLLPAMFYSALLGLVYSGFRRWGGSALLAIGLTAGFASLPNLLFWSQQFYAELPLTYYLLAMMWLISWYWRSAEPGYLLVAALMAGFATQTKIEGGLLVMPVIMALRLRATQSQTKLATGREVILFIGLVTLIGAPWIIYRRFIAPYTELLNFEGGASVLQNLVNLPLILNVISDWLMTPSFLGMFALIFPLTAFLLLVKGRAIVKDKIWVYWLVQNWITTLPPILLFLVQPIWLEVARLGRYFVLFTAITYALMGLLIIELFSQTSKIRKPIQWLLIARFVTLATLGAIMSYEGLANLWLGFVRTEIFSSRPTQVWHETVAEAQTMLQLDAIQRRVLLAERNGWRDFGRLIELALAVTPKDKNVAFWVPHGPVDNFLWQRSAYLLYPRRIHFLAVPEQLTPQALQSQNIGTVIALGRPMDGLIVGQWLTTSPQAYSLARIDVREGEANQTSSFISAVAQFAEGITLQGYQPLKFLNGEKTFILEWYAHKTPSTSYTAFVHIYSGDTLIAQHDSLPGLGLNPTQLWSPGTTILDAHTIQMPTEAQRELTICFGMYESISLKRLPIIRVEGFTLRDNLACNSLQK